MCLLSSESISVTREYFKNITKHSSLYESFQGQRRKESQKINERIERAADNFQETR